VFRLNEETRWFELVGSAPKPELKDLSVSDIKEYLSSVGGRSNRKRIIATFSDISTATIDRRLKDGLEVGAVTSDGKGKYSVYQFVTAIGDDNVIKEDSESIEVEL